MRALLAAAALVFATVAPAQAEPVHRAASCDEGHKQTRHVYVHADDHTNVYTETRYFAECVGFDRTSGIRLTIYRPEGDCATQAEIFMYRAAIYRWVINPDAMGDWNPGAWTPRCRKGTTWYATTLRPPGDGYVYNFPGDPVNSKCVATSFKEDWRVLKPLIGGMRDKTYRTPRACVDGK